MAFSNNLLQVMKTRKLTKKQLAKRLDVSVTAVSHWCAGRRNPTFEHLSILSSYLGAEIFFYLMTGRKYE